MGIKIAVSPLAFNHPVLFRLWAGQACNADNPQRKVWCDGFTVADMLRLNVGVKEDERFA